MRTNQDFCAFFKPKQVATLEKGMKIRVLGKINLITDNSVVLEKCKIVTQNSAKFNIYCFIHINSLTSHSTPMSDM